MHFPPNVLAVVFKKQEIAQQVVTKMQDLASEFSKIFRGWYLRTLTAGRGKGCDPSRTQHPARPLQAPRCWDPNLGPPQLFSRGCAAVGWHLRSISCLSSAQYDLRCRCADLLWCVSDCGCTCLTRVYSTEFCYSTIRPRRSSSFIVLRWWCSG